MSNTISPELQKQIEQEADVITSRMNDRNDYDAGKIKGFEEGYIKAGEKYAEKWQEAERRATEVIEKVTDLMDFVAEAKGHISDKEIISQVRKSLPGLLEALTANPTPGSTDRIAQSVINNLEYLEKLKNDDDTRTEL